MMQYYLAAPAAVLGLLWLLMAPAVAEGPDDGPDWRGWWDDPAVLAPPLSRNWHWSTR